MRFQGINPVSQPVIIVSCSICKWEITLRGCFFPFDNSRIKNSYSHNWYTWGFCSCLRIIKPICHFFMIDSAVPIVIVKWHCMRLLWHQLRLRIEINLSAFHVTFNCSYFKRKNPKHIGITFIWIIWFENLKLMCCDRWGQIWKWCWILLKQFTSWRSIQYVFYFYLFVYMYLSVCLSVFFLYLSIYLHTHTYIYTWLLIIFM